MLSNRAMDTEFALGIARVAIFFIAVVLVVKWFNG